MSTEVYKPHGGTLHNLTRVRAIRRMAKTAGEAKVKELYVELYGAFAGPKLTVERMRESLEEACAELLDTEEPVEPDVDDLL